MKKSLLAIVAMTAFAGAAHAQSSVTVYGIVDIGYGASNNSTTTYAGAKTTVSGRSTGNASGQSTSRLGFKGTEDLGGGTKANFVLEYGLGETAAGANSWSARESWIGLANAKTGELRLGRQYQSVHGAITNGLAGGANNVTGSIYSKNTSSATLDSASIRPHAVYMDNAVTYISPIMSGLTLQAQTGQSFTTASDASPSIGSRESGASLTFTGVKNLSVAYGISQANAVAAATNGKTTVQALSANYNFGVAQVFALGTQQKVDTIYTGANLKTSAYELGVKAPVTPKIGVWASVYTGNRTLSGATGGTTVSTANGDVGGFQLGSSYAFSKRTNAYAIYGQQNIKGKDTASGAKVESSAYAVGLRHTF